MPPDASIPFAMPLLAPLLQTVITGLPAFFNSATRPLIISSGIFLDPLICPFAYSPAVRTSIITAPFSNKTL